MTDTMEAAPWEVPADLLADSDFVSACRAAPEALVYLLLNVGDGDTQLLLLPDLGGGRRAIVVDAATTRKLPALVDTLAGEQLLAPPGAGRFPLVVATHPHADHIGGLPEFLRRHGDEVSEFWEPGYYHPSASFVETMVELEDHRGILHSQPTSGMTRYVDRARLTVLAPGIGLRGRFDSYGVHINNASLALRVAFPNTRVSEVAAGEEVDGVAVANRNYFRLNEPWSLLLGADAQTVAWAQAVVDFPEVVRDPRNPALQRELRLGLGEDPLRAQIFKVPHHASKHGLNLELVERIQPRLALVSSEHGGRYGFPHRLTLDALREAREPTTTSGSRHAPDHELGIHYTCATVHQDGQETPLGSLALLIHPRRGSALRMWRFGDEPKAALDPRKAQELTLH